MPLARPISARNNQRPAPAADPALRRPLPQAAKVRHGSKAVGHCPAPWTDGSPRQDCAGLRRRARHSRTPVAKRQAHGGRSQRTAFAIVQRPRPVPQTVAPRRVAGAQRYRRSASRSPHESCAQWPAAEPAGRPARSGTTLLPACPPLRDQTTPQTASCPSGAVPIPAHHVSVEKSATPHNGPGSKCERDKPAYHRDRYVLQSPCLPA